MSNSYVCGSTGFRYIALVSVFSRAHKSHWIPKSQWRAHKLGLSCEVDGNPRPQWHQKLNLPLTPSISPLWKLTHVYKEQFWLFFARVQTCSWITHDSAANDVVPGSDLETKAVCHNGCSLERQLIGLCSRTPGAHLTGWCNAESGPRESDLAVGFDMVEWVCVRVCERKKQRKNNCWLQLRFD